MIEIKIDDEIYTEEQYKKDYVRMMDSLRKGTEDIGEKNCKSVLCEKCPLYEKTCFLDSESDGEQCDYNCFETVKIVHDWSKKHPVVTNRDKIKDVFGFNMTSWDDAKLNGKDFDFNKWLDEEYKEPHKETGKEND